MKSHHYLETLSVFFLSLSLFIFGLQTQEIVGFDSRFYLFAREALQYGIRWFPTAYQQPYPDYTSASTCLIYCFALLFGGLNKWIAVLPTAIAAAITVTLTYLIGALHQRRLGLYAVFFLLMTFMFYKSGRSIAIDMYPAALTAGCFYLLYAGDLRGQSKSVWWLYLFLFLGFVFRGPIGLVMPAGVVCVYYWLTRRFAKLLFFSLGALVVLLLSGAALMWLAYQTGGTAFVHDVLRMQVLGRMDQHAVPFYFYFTDGMLAYALSFPVAVMTTLLAVYAVKRGERLTHTGFLVHLIGWLLVIVLGMSVPGGKKIRYILPMAPAAALIAAYPLVMGVNVRYLTVLRTVLLKLFLFLPGLCLLAVEVMYFYLDKRGVSADIAFGWLAAMLALIQAASLFVYYRYLPRIILRDTLTMLFAVISFIAVCTGLVEPLENTANRTRELVLAVEQQRLDAQAALVFYRENPDSMAIKYRLNMPVLEQPIFVNDEHELLALKQPIFVVMRKEVFAALSPAVLAHFQMIAHDELGHVEVVILSSNRGR